MRKLFFILLIFVIGIFSFSQTLVPYLKLNGRYIFVDSITMKPAFDKEFAGVSMFAEGLAAVSLNGKIGYIDKTGKEIIPLKYDDASEFSDGWARVIMNNKYSVIDKTGKELFPFTYSFMGEFTDGMAVVRMGDQSGYIDKTGKEIIPVKYNSLGDFKDGLAIVEINGKFGFINKSGTLVVPAKYDEAYEFSHGVASVAFNGKYGYIDTKGKEIIPLKYHFAAPAAGELLQVTINNGKGGFLRGFINRAGQPVIPVKYEEISEISRDIFLAKSGGKIQLINKKLAKLAEWDQYDSWKISGEGIAFLQIKKSLPDGGKYVMINKEGKEVISEKLEYGGELKDGITSFKSNGKWGFMDKTGKIIAAAKYEDLLGFKNGYSGVKQNNRWFTIDLAGREYREMEKPLPAGWVFAEEFDDNRNSWTIDSTEETQFKMWDGYYIINRKKDIGFKYTRIYNLDDTHDYKIEAVIEKSYGNVQAEFGLVFGRDGKREYTFMITNDGYFRIDENNGTKLMVYKDFTFTDAIHRGRNNIDASEENKLTVLKINGKWSFRINDREVYSTTSTPFYGKGIGFLVAPKSLFYVNSLKIYDWTLAGQSPDQPKEPIYNYAFYDDFKTNRYEWPEFNDQDVESKFVNNEYRVKYKTDKGYVMPRQKIFQNMQPDFRCELSTTFIEGGAYESYGLCYGSTDINNAYLFLINKNGGYWIGRMIEGRWSDIVKWSNSDAVNKKNIGSNILRVEKTKEKIFFYINDQLVFTHFPETPYLKLEGRIGFYVGGKLTIVLNYLKVDKIEYKY